MPQLRRKYLLQLFSLHDDSDTAVTYCSHPFDEAILTRNPRLNMLNLHKILGGKPFVLLAVLAFNTATSLLMVFCSKLLRTFSMFNLGIRV